MRQVTIETEAAEATNGNRRQQGVLPVFPARKCSLGDEVYCFDCFNSQKTQQLC